MQLFLVYYSHLIYGSALENTFLILTFYLSIITFIEIDTFICT